MTLLDHYPICPVAYRTDAQGRPNALGDRYERLVELNRRTAALLPPASDPDHLKATLDHDPSDLVAAMRAILGFNRDPATPAADEDTLLPLLLRALFGCDPDAAPLARSCLLTVRLRARI